ncbi:MAG: hypothetical protein PV354_08120 [Bartonella sp.]|nr:hypothetical protein [Bartonella sp.]
MYIEYIIDGCFLEIILTFTEIQAYLDNGDQNNQNIQHNVKN